jgi:hypothetical protein
MVSTSLREENTAQSLWIADLVSLGIKKVEFVQFLAFSEAIEN